MTSLIGIFLLVVSQAIYVQEKSLLQSKQPSHIYEESFVVKVLDMCGCALLTMPLFICVIVIGIKVARQPLAIATLAA